MYIKVIVPIAIPTALSYKVPMEWRERMKFGIRVEVPFGKKKRYAALIIETDVSPPDHQNIKSILQPIDDEAIITAPQLRLWRWIADYYACTLGEVMHAAVPAALKMASETIVVLHPQITKDLSALSNEEYLIVEALEQQKELSLKEVSQILDKKTTTPLLQEMMRKNIIILKEEMNDQYSEKKEKYLRFQPPYHPEAEELREAFDACSRSTHQTNLLLLLTQEARKKEVVPWSMLSHKAEVSLSVAQAMEKKGIIEIIERTVSRLPEYGSEDEYSDRLNEEQQQALEELLTPHPSPNIHLLKGVTGSGKTQVYIECIQKAIDRGEQVLYMVPEIGLTTQLTERLEKCFGNHLAVYHSKLNSNERVEVWHSTLQRKKIILAPRSGILLPFQNLGLIILDEEHDRSFKQYDPAPRYHARSAAIMYAAMENFQVILGSATPSFDTYYKSQNKHYHFSQLKTRYGGVSMPEIELIDISGTGGRLKMKGSFSEPFLEKMEHHLSMGEQIILFHNRRGYVPIIHCTTCGWHAMCRHCDISLTLHKKERKLKCHYCGYQQSIHSQCPDCGSPSLVEKGMGTQKVEDELEDIFPQTNIERLDWDTARGKHSFQKIVRRFEQQRTQILIGTQMVSKGLDFDNVGMVGVVDADQLLFFPDFRTNEVAYQLLTQVAGRAGRRQKKGYVCIQTNKSTHPVLQKVLSRDYEGLYRQEMKERKSLGYPPFERLIQMEIKHKNPEKSLRAAQALHHYCIDKIDGVLHPPAQAPIPRISNFYIYHLQIKLEDKASVLKQAKELLKDGVLRLKKSRGYSTVRIKIDVDPY